MRIILVFVSIVIYLFLLVYIESELVKIEVKKENLQHRLSDLESRKKHLQFEIVNMSNLAFIEEQAKQRGYKFPDESDILGVLE